MNQNTNPVLGILGGLGPMSSAYFYEMITEHTKASCDQEHIDIVLSSAATTPDRTGYILGEHNDNPALRMIENAQKLEKFGCNVIAIPCNTAHYFYDEVQANVSVPIINIIKETVKLCHLKGAKTIGIMATDGTVSTDTYQQMASNYGLRCVVPSKECQKLVMEIIYGQIKQGKPADMELFNTVCDELRGLGCERIVLGCTELSLLKKENHLGAYFIDALEVLAWRSILYCGKTPIGFEEFDDEL